MVTSAETHTHQWVFLGELLMTYTKAELRRSDPDLRRLEHCCICSTVRLHMGGDSWAVVQGEVTRDFLQQFETEKSQTVKTPSPQLTFRVPKTNKSRLGKGLSDLMREAQQHGTEIKGLFPAKPEKKN